MTASPSRGTDRCWFFCCAAHGGKWHFLDVMRARGDVRFGRNSGHAADWPGGPRLTTSDMLRGRFVMRGGAVIHSEVGTGRYISRSI